MDTTHGATAPALSELSRDIREYSLFQGVLLVLERLRREHPGLDDARLYQLIEFQANPSLGFPGSDIEKVEYFKENGKVRARLRLNLISLFGAGSPLPAFYGEQALGDNVDGNPTRDFLDLFNDRLQRLLFPIWQKYRYYSRFASGARDPFSSQLFSLIGLGGDAIREQPELNWKRLLPYLGLLSLRNQIAEQERQQQALNRDYQSGLAINNIVLSDMESSLAQARADAQTLQDRWEIQIQLVKRLLTLREQCSSARLQQTTGVASSAEQQAPTPAELEKQLETTRTQLHQAQADERLVSYEVCPRLIAEVISHWTGVPLTHLAREHNAAITHFADHLGARLRGQEQAVEALNRAMRASAAGLNRTDAPVGVFLLVGPSGVGKTETALALADLLYGGERFLTTINMSEFQEKHSVSRLIGAPPGYVGYGEGGMLTEAVRQKPYSVVLLDEVEKADTDVMNVFYQIFDKGVANDGEGREINFRNTLILMTSNLAGEQILTLCSAVPRPSADDLEKAIQPTLSRHFKPALLARMQVVPYYPVACAVMRELISLKLPRFAQRLQKRDVKFTHCDALVDHFAARCTQGETGARLIDRLIDQQLQPLAVDRLLAAIASGEQVRQAHATLDDQGAVTCDFA
jgi:type VI secretion system protein VasG